MSINIEADARDRADMEKLQAGHDAALNDLMERHAAPVFHFLCRMVGNEDDANDLAQETFVRVFKSAKSFRAEQKFSTWLFTIAANLARNHFRWRSRHPNGSLDDIAGICNERRNVMGMMPHPERAADALLGSTDGLAVLQSMLHTLVVTGAEPEKVAVAPSLVSTRA